MAKDGKSPAFQFYPKDFYSDEHVELMTNQQQGCYIKLLSHQWLHGSIPADVNEMALICREPASVMKRIWPRISQCFVPSTEGRLVNKRMERDRQEYAAYCAKQIENGRKGGRPKSDTQAEPSGKPKQNQTVNSGLTHTKAKKTTASASLDADVINSSVANCRARETESDSGSFESRGGEIKGKVERPALVNAARKPNPNLGPYRILADEPEHCVIEFANRERRLWVDSEIGWSILHRPEATP